MSINVWLRLTVKMLWCSRQTSIFLMRFKNEYEQMSPHVKIFCFTKNSLFEHWLGSNQIDKLIVDYDFSSAIFGSGVIYLKYFFKQNRKNRAVISLERFNRYYLISSYDDVMKEKEHLNWQTS